MSHETTVLFEEILKIAHCPDVLSSDSSKMRMEIIEQDAAHEKVFHCVRFGPYGSLTWTARISLTNEGVETEDLIRSKDALIPYSDPKLFNKIRSLVKWSNPWRSR